MDDAIETLESKEGLTWLFIKDNHVRNTIFWSWERLYKFQVE